MIQSIGPHKVTNASIEHPVVDQMLAEECTSDREHI
jgi:hypothetical protein